MKSLSKYFIIILIGLIPIIAKGQNVPDANNLLSQLPTPTPIILPSAFSSGNNPIVSKFNYVRAWEPQIPITDVSLIDENISPFTSKMSTSYVDGFGRNIQSIKRYASSTEDLVQLTDNRISVNKFSFLPYSASGNSRFQQSPFVAQKAYYDNKFPDESSTSYSLNLYTSSANKYSVKTFSPGKGSVGQKVGIEISDDINAVGEVFIININPSSQLPQKIGLYPSGQLVKKIRTGDDGSYTEENFDNEGKLICKTIFAGYQTCPGGSTLPPPSGTSATGSGNQCPVYYRTYYVYDDFGRLRYTLSPKAIEQLNLNSWQFTSVILDNLSDYSIYDERGRIVESHVAGEAGNNLVVYDLKGRIVLTQSPKLRETSQWNFNLYDAFDRVTVTGLVVSTNTRPIWQSILLNPSSVSSHNTPAFLEYYIAFMSGEGTYPSTLNSALINSYTYYDGYSNPFFNGAQFNTNIFTGNTVSSVYAITPTVSYRTKGMITGKNVRVVKPSGNTLNCSDWLGSIYYYDDNGRGIETLVQNFNQANNVPSTWDIVATQYNFRGLKLREICKNNNPLCTAKPSTQTVKDYIYSTYNFQLTSVRQIIDNGTWRDISAYTYNSFGQCTNKTIGGIETRSYNYNIRNQLIGINKSYAEGSISSGTITFGESIKYDYGFTKPLYNGNVAGLQWRGAGNAPIRAYGYTYDQAGRMSQADFSQFSNTTGIWDNHDVDFTEGSLNYDANSNIISLKRSGQTIINGVQQPSLIDDLTFHYENNEASNRVQSIADNISGSPTNYDFKDGNTSSTDYSYDAQGNLNGDLNKHVTLVNNFLNLPESVSFQNGDKISYLYDAQGNKLAESYSVGGQNYVMEYMGTFVYKNNNPYLIKHDEGYARYNSAGTFDYFYFVKDHLGNTRNVLSAQSATYTQQYFADHEIASAQTEQLVFSNIDEVRDTKPDQTDPADTKAAVLDANDPTKRIGTSIILKVMAGDKFSLSSQTYYDGDPKPDDGLDPKDVMNSIISTLVGGVGGIEGGEKGNSDIINNLFSPDNYIGVFDAIKKQATNTSIPQAYLNYISFDDNMRIIPEQSGAIQIGGQPASWQTIGTNGEITINNSGFLAIYISSEAKSMKVSFDKISISHFVGSLVDENHYYPFGLTVNTATSNPLENRYLFLGNMLEKTNSLNIYDFGARQYDPQLGRFLNNDPLKQYYSGYTYSANNPIMVSDKTGLLGADVWGSMGISGTSSGLGFSMDAGARDAGYTALNRTVSFFAIAGLTWFAGEVLGAAFGGEGLLDAAYEEEQGAAAEYASARGYVDAQGNYNYTGLNMDALAERGVYSVDELGAISRTEIASGGKVYSPRAEMFEQYSASQKAQWDGLNAFYAKQHTDIAAMASQYEEQSAQYTQMAASLAQDQGEFFAMEDMVYNGNITPQYTGIGRMNDLRQFEDNPFVDTWHKSGPINLDGKPITWQQNRAWLDEKILRGDKFLIATDPATLPPVKNGYTEGMPNGYFTAREYDYLTKQGINIIPFY